MIAPTLLAMLDCVPLKTDGMDTRAHFDNDGKPWIIAGRPTNNGGLRNDSNEAARRSGNDRRP
jgi:hypothetical protein